MALGFARALAPDGISFENAALDSLGRVDPMARYVMAELGIEIGGLHGRRVDRRAVEAADLVVLLAASDEWVGAAPAMDKTVRWDIDDPLGWPRDIYDDIRDEIRNRVHELVEWAIRERDEYAPAAEAPVPLVVTAA